MSDIPRATTSTKDDPRPIPAFETEEEAREFWATHDSTDYWDQMEDVTATSPTQLRTGPGRERSRARKRPPEGRMDLVSLRFPAEMIEAVKEIAAQRHLPYQTLMRSWIGERLAEQQREGMSMPQRETSTGMEATSIPPGHSPEAVEALIERLNRDSDAIMRGRIFTDDSAATLREIREERTAAQSTR